MTCSWLLLALTKTKISLYIPGIHTNLYAQQPLILYELETVPVPIIDQNMHAHSYTQLQIRKPYIALNSETYIYICSKN